MARADSALKQIVEWQGGNEQDFYPYLKDLFRYVLGYPAEYVKIGETKQGVFPDLSLVSKDGRPKDGIFWVVGEVKPEPGRFRKQEERQSIWDTQLKKYVSADTVYALLVDPLTIAVCNVQGETLHVVELDAVTPEDLRSSGHDNSLAFLSFDSSVSEVSLGGFRDGTAPSRYVDVSSMEGRERFYESLRISTRELIQYAQEKLDRELQDYREFEKELQTMKTKTIDANPDTNPAFGRALKELESRHQRSIRLVQQVIEDFKRQVGKQLPGKADEQMKFLLQLFACEASSLVLSRILFVRFFEDYDMTTRKISNGGIKRFRDFHRHIRDDYRFLLTDAYKDLERVYRRLFEASLFDWAHDEDGELSKLLLRIFYRLNAFDFRQITGDILGNLYERFLDPDKRKKLGEFYTPEWIADYILERIGFFDDPGPLLDPACGSGTFLIRAIEGFIQRRTAPPYNVSLKTAIEQAVRLVHGLDINVFAAFIAQLQIIWHLFPYLRHAGIDQIPDLHVYGGLNSLAYDVFSLDRPIQTLGEREALAVREPAKPYKYVVGNPPYIRTERLKAEETSWREIYSKVDYGKSDISFFFIHRAIAGAERKAGKAVQKFDSWLEEGGTLGFVLPLGIADSVAAGPLRTELLQERIVEVVDLEEVAHDVFTSQIAKGRATVAPMILIVRKAAPEKDITVRLVSGASCKTDKGIRIHQAPLSIIPRNLFEPSDSNPYGQFLTKVCSDDIPILTKLMKGRRKAMDFAASLIAKGSQKKSKGKAPSNKAVTIGVFVGTGRKVLKDPADGLTPIGKGAHVYAYYVDEEGIDEYVDLQKVQSKSIWAHPELIQRRVYAFSEIGLAPQCGLLDPRKVCLSKSAVLFVPDQEYEDFPWDAYFNSFVPRYVFSLVLRSALIGAGTINPKTGVPVAWSHIHGRVVAALPVPDAIMDRRKDLLPITEELRTLARKINRRWRAVEEAIRQSVTKPLSLYAVDFSEWTSLDEGEELHLESKGDNWWLQVYDGEGQQKLSRLKGDRQLLDVVKYLIETEAFEDEIGLEKIENLEVPTDFAEISELIINAKDGNSPDILRFKELLSAVDEIVAEAYNLTDEETKYIMKRLDSPPLNNFRPRYPWDEVAKRAIVTYEEDRYA